MVILCAFLGAACLWDYKFRRIPNILIILLLTYGLIYTFYMNSWKGVAGFAISMLAVSAVLFLFFRFGMLGAGDVKLLGVASGFFSGTELLLFLLFSMGVGAVIGIVQMLIRHELKNRFVYLGRYVQQVISCGKAGLYISERSEKVRLGIVMSGPMLVAALMHLLGIY